MLAVTEVGARRIWPAKPNFSKSGKPSASLYASRRSARRFPDLEIFEVLDRVRGCHFLPAIR
jgi:hypothetical protein